MCLSNVDHSSCYYLNMAAGLTKNSCSTRNEAQISYSSLDQRKKQSPPNIFLFFLILKEIKAKPHK